MKRTVWTDEKFESDLKSVAGNLGYMPSVSQLKQMHRNDLSCQIVRRGGFRKVAEQYGFKREFSDSDYGWQGEAEVTNTLEGLGFSVTTGFAVKSPFDLLVNNVVRVDVKTAKFARYGPCSGWFYRIGKIPQSDVVILHQADTGKDCVLHWSDCPTTNVTIAADGGKYAEFIGAYKIIDQLTDKLSEFRLSIPKPK